MILQNSGKRKLSNIIHISVHDSSKKEPSPDKESKDPGPDKENQDPDTKNQNKDLTNKVTLFDVPDIIDKSDQDLVAASQITDNQVMEANMLSNTDFTQILHNCLDTSISQ